MLSVLNKWFEGWKCIGRIIWFLFVLSIFSIPIRIVIAFFEYYESNTQPVYSLIGIFGLIVISPLCFYFACHYTSRFNKPKPLAYGKIRTNA